MLNIENKSSYKNIDKELLEKIKNSLTNKEVEVIFVEDQLMRELNREYRGKDYPTDVLSFPIEMEFENMPLGTIIININKAKEGAKEFNHSIDSEIALLFIHGLLHLLGFDHEIDNGEMREKEAQLIKEFNLPSSLIIRGEEH